MPSNATDEPRGFDAVRPPTMADMVADQLRTQIVRGELAEGDALPPENELMERFGVSRPTLREAFRVLESESLVRIRRGVRGGAIVKAPDLGVAARYTTLLLQARGTTIQDVYRARTDLEPPAVGMLARRPTKRVVVALRKALAAEQAVVDQPVELAVASAVFHDLLVQLTGNTALSVLSSMLAEIMETQFVAATRASRRPEEFERLRRRNVHAHAKLVDLIEAGNEAGAEEYWREHMEAAGKVLLGTVGSKSLVELLE